MEKKAFSSVFQDGLWDIFIGFFLAQFAVAPLLSDLGFSDLWSSMIWTTVMLAVLFAIFFLKKHVVTQRLGTVRLKKRNKSRYMVVLGLLNVFLFIGILASALFLSAIEHKIDWIMPFTFMLIVLASFSVIAWLFRQSRFYLYGVLCALSFGVGELLYQHVGAKHHGWTITFGIASCLVTLTGIWLFVTFMRKYPKTLSDLNLQGDHDDNG